MNKKINLSIGIVAIILVAGIGYWQWSVSPTCSLLKLATAIKEHDRDQAEKYLDVESVASNVMDQIFAQLPKVQPSGDQWAAAGQNMALGLIEMMKPKLSQIAKEKFLGYVETGKFENLDGEAGPEGALTSTMKSATAPGAEFKGVTSVKKDGKIALVRLSMLDGSKREIFPEIKMRDKGSYWQVIGINNFSEIVQANRSGKSQ